MGMSGLNAFEQVIVDKLLGGSNKVLAMLRAQASSARLISRQDTGVGFFCEFEVPLEVPSVVPADFELGDVDATMDGLEHGAGFLLFVRDGRLTTLEGYSYEEPWPAVMKNVELRYRIEPRPLPFE